MNLAGPSLLATAAIVTAATVADAQGSPATFLNHSSVGIHHVYVSPSGADAWGLDRLGQNVFQPGDSLQLTGVRCDPADVKLVDQVDRPCVLRHVRLCQKDSVFDLTDEVLALCRQQR
jgi:hypothetical protein